LENDEVLIDGVFQMKRAKDSLELAKYNCDEVYEDEDSNQYEKTEQDYKVKAAEETVVKLEDYFVDGTKIEANANRYTFTWKKATERYNQQLNEKFRQLVAHIEETTDNGGERVYLGDHHGDGTLKITDSYGNKLSDISYKDERIPGILTFTKGTEVYKVEVTNFSNPFITLPNADGIFEVTFTLGGHTEIPDDRVKPDVSGTWKTWGNDRVVASDYKWTIKFNNELNASTVNGNNIFVVDQDGYLVKGVGISLAADQKTVYVSAPNDTGYESGQQYICILMGMWNQEAVRSFLQKLKCLLQLSNSLKISARIP